ncbi:hypothetical protein BVRB_7g176950 [Beta vulgaris subsp. vulgaris]|nr:hypothetical protein BVRB_7g176950 [Beta vulgaris subsp. vulgaris]
MSSSSSLSEKHMAAIEELKAKFIKIAVVSSSVKEKEAETVIIGSYIEMEKDDWSGSSSFYFFFVVY